MCQEAADRCKEAGIELGALHRGGGREGKHLWRRLSASALRLLSATLPLQRARTPFPHPSQASLRCTLPWTVSTFQRRSSPRLASAACRATSRQCTRSPPRRRRRYQKHYKTRFSGRSASERQGGEMGTRASTSIFPHFRGCGPPPPFSKLKGRELWENLEVAEYWQNVGKASVLRDLYHGGDSI